MINKEVPDGAVVNAILLLSPPGLDAAKQTFVCRLLRKQYGLTLKESFKVVLEAVSAGTVDQFEKMLWLVPLVYNYEI